MQRTTFQPVSSVTPEQILENLPKAVFNKLKGRVLNAVEVYLDPADPRYEALRKELCGHISESSLFVARQLQKAVDGAGIHANLTSYIEQADGLDR